MSKDIWQGGQKREEGKVNTGTRATISLHMEMGFHEKAALAEITFGNSLPVVSLQNLEL